MYWYADYGLFQWILLFGNQIFAQTRLLACSDNPEDSRGVQSSVGGLLVLVLNNSTVQYGSAVP